jgi:hypothetical protein
MSLTKTVVYSHISLYLLGVIRDFTGYYNG